MGLQHIGEPKFQFEGITATGRDAWDHFTEGLPMDDMFSRSTQQPMSQMDA